jgi:hypothetical protein
MTNECISKSNWNDYMKQSRGALNSSNINAINRNQSTTLHMRATIDSQYAKELGIPPVKTLLDYNAHINAQDEFGDTPLHVAVTRRFFVDLPFIQALIDGKSDLSLKNNGDWTPQQADHMTSHYLSDEGSKDRETMQKWLTEAAKKQKGTSGTDKDESKAITKTTK